MAIFTKSRKHPLLFTLTPICFLNTSGGIQAQQQPAKPNIIIILADDMGYSDLGCYGSEINTPNIDNLANNGIRFTHFYNAGRCWPTRASLLSGYYPNAIGMDPVSAKREGPDWVKTMPQYLNDAGYETYHVGKWHYFNKPRPTTDGGFSHSCLLDHFDNYFYNYELELNGRGTVKLAKENQEYIATALTDHAILFLEEHRNKVPGKPFFLYLAFNTPHFPLKAPASDIEKYKDRYNKGWDHLKKERWRKMKKMGLVNCRPSRSEPGVNQTYPHLMSDSVLIDSLGGSEVLYPVPWKSLAREEKQFQSVKMAIHAAMVDRIDQETGRVINQLKKMDAFDNTVIFFMSDNGASAEIMIRGNGHDRLAEPGSEASYLCLGPGWAGASNTPFRRYKSWTHEGGISTPLIVHWPEGIKEKGAIRNEQGHVVDFIPTFLDLTGMNQAETLNGSIVPPLPGKSLLPAILGNKSVSHDFLFFHHYGLFKNDPDNCALRMGQWKIVSSNKDGKNWELYDLRKDRSEQKELSGKNPEIVRQMVQKWTELDELYKKQSYQINNQ
jgi:arylsulfatase